MTKIDISSTAIEKGIDVIKGFLDAVLKPGAEEVGLIIADQIRSFRFFNQVRLFENAKARIKEKGIKIKKIPVKTLVPLLEGASLEEDEELKDMWVGLLVNAVDSEKNFSSSVFPHILSQLSTSEAKFLQLFKRVVDKETGTIRKVQFKHYQEEWITDAEIWNLIRLGLIDEEGPRRSTNLLGNHYTFLKLEHPCMGIYDITSFGKEFLSACELG